MIVPAQVVASEERARVIGEAVVDQAGGDFARPLRFFAKQIPELVLNSLAYAPDSVVKPIACVMHDRIEDELQLVVADMGRGLSQSDAAGSGLRSAVEGRESGGLLDLVLEAAHRDIDLSLMVASGTARLGWRAGTWISLDDEFEAPGFVVGVTAHL